MQNIDLLVHNAYILDGLTAPRPCAAMAIHGGVILEIGDESTLCTRYQPAQWLDAAGKYVFPGLINTHDHLFQVLTKGLGKELPLWQWLENTIRQMTPYINEEAIYYAALAGCMENLHSGATTLLDFQYCHSHPGQFDAVCQALHDSGIRGYVGRIRYTGDYLGLSTVEKESTQDYFRNISTLLSRFTDRSMLDVALIAPGMPGLLDDPLYEKGFFREIRACAEDLRIPYTQHLVETADDDAYMLEKTGKTSVAFLEEQGFFGERCVLAHCVNIAETDYEIFRRHKVKVSHNPVSNMILASGISPVRRFLDEGISVSLATDGAGSNDSQDMLETLKFACLLQKVSSLDAQAMTAEKTLALATLGGARALNRDDLGCLAAGKKADFFLYDPHILKSAPVADPIASLIYASGEANIHTVVVNGKVVISGGRFQTLDEGKIVESLERCAYGVRCAARIDVPAGCGHG